LINSICLNLNDLEDQVDDLFGVKIQTAKYCIRLSKTQMMTCFENWKKIADLCLKSGLKSAAPESAFHSVLNNIKQ
jgi:hypothetical protein